LEEDDKPSRADDAFKRRRDLRDGLIALAVLIAIIAAPAVGAAVQAHEQSGNASVAMEGSSETTPGQNTPVAEKEAEFVPLVVNAVKNGDTALTGTGTPGFVVRVLFDEQERPSEATVGKNNTWTIVTPSGVSLKAGDEKVLDVTQNDPKTSASYRPGAKTPTKPKTQEDPVVAEEPEPTTETPEESDPEQIWHDPWSERVLVRSAWSEQVLAKEAWTETIPHPAEYETIYETDPETGEQIAIGERTVREAWTETVEHPAEYTTVYHDAEYTTVYHDGYWE
jgi:hypothetical protein